MLPAEVKIDELPGTDSFEIDTDLEESHWKFNMCGTTGCSSKPLQWACCILVCLGTLVWLIIGNPHTGAIYVDASTPVDSYLVPMMVGVVAYVAAYGYLSPPCATTQSRA